MAHSRGHACELSEKCIQWSTDQFLNRGGYGEVSFAKSNMPNEEFVALKKVVQRRKKEDRVRKKLEEEANILSELSHKNILKIHGWFISHSHHNYYLVMEYVENGSVDDFIDKYGENLDLSHTKFYICCEVADGVKYLHEQNPVLIHRDLKPSNVLLGKIQFTSVVIKIGDFGLSEWKDVSRSVTVEQGSELEDDQKERRRWRRACSRFYMPPEYWQDVKAKPNEMYDVYSYAILCWELIMEARPFEGVHAFEEALKKGERPEPLPRPSSSQLKKMTDLIQKCWAQRKTDRPTFADIVRELQNYRSDISHKEAVKEELSKLMKKIIDERKTQISVLPTNVTPDCSLVSQPLLSPENPSGLPGQPQQQLPNGKPEPYVPPPPGQETAPGVSQPGYSNPPQDRVSFRSNYTTGPNPPQQIQHDKNAEYYHTGPHPPIQRNTATEEIDLGRASNREAFAGAEYISQGMGSLQIDGPPTGDGDSEGASGGIPLVVSDFQSPPLNISPESNADQVFNFPSSPLLPATLNEVTTRTDEEAQERRNNPIQRDLSLDASMTGQENQQQEPREPQQLRTPSYSEACSGSNQQQPRRDRSPSPPPNGGSRSTPVAGPTGDRSRDPSSGERSNELGGKGKQSEGQKKTRHKQINITGGHGQPINVTNTFIAGGDQTQRNYENVRVNQGGFVPPFFPEQHITASTASIINIDNADHIQIGNNNTYYHGAPPPMHMRGFPKKPKTTKKVKITGSNRVVDDDNMLRVAQHLGRPWKLLGRKMGFSNGEIDAIDIDYQQDGLQEKVYRLLHKWVEKKGKEASYRKLADMLIDIKKVEVAAMLKPPERIPSE